MVHSAYSLPRLPSTFKRQRWLKRPLYSKPQPRLNWLHPRLAPYLSNLAQSCTQDKRKPVPPIVTPVTADSHQTAHQHHQQTDSLTPSEAITNVSESPELVIDHIVVTAHTPTGAPLTTGLSTTRRQSREPSRPSAPPPSPLFRCRTGSL